MAKRLTKEQAEHNNKLCRQRYYYNNKEEVNEKIAIKNILKKFDFIQTEEEALAFREHRNFLKKVYLFRQNNDNQTIKDIFKNIFDL